LEVCDTKNPADQPKFQKNLQFLDTYSSNLFGRSGPVMFLSFFVKNATNFRFLIVIKNINCKIKILLSQAFKSNDLDEV